MKPHIDLHMHSTASDGTDTPAGLLERVKAAGLRVFALTDHDAVDGVRELAGNIPEGITFIPGIEFSCRMASGKCHILGYGCDMDHPSFADALDRGAALRRAKLETRIAFMKERGIHIPEAELDALRQMPSAGKPHLGNLMVKYGCARTRDEAITGTLNLCRTGPSRIEAEAAVKAILAVGGVPVWAHPLGGTGEPRVGRPQFEAMLTELLAYSLRGLECWYSEYPAESCRKLAQVAAEHGLLISGGSDYHGTNKAVDLGTLNADGEEVRAEQLTLLDEPLGG